jgi:hypothetical protein
MEKQSIEDLWLMGLSQHCLGVTQQIRKQVGKAPGDIV